MNNFNSNPHPRSGVRKRYWVTSWIQHKIISVGLLWAQYDERPKIVYNQDKWVAVTNYQQYELTDLVDLWYWLNKHLSHVLRFMPEEMSKHQVETEQLHDLRWLAEDYIKHLLHHLHQVLDLDPVAYP